VSALAVGVVLYRNSRRELAPLLASLQLCREEPRTPPFQVAWLDNSEDGSGRAVLASLAPDAACRDAGANLGFGRAHNRLMAEAFADPACSAYVCVNPDAVLHPRCLAELAKEAQAERTGLVDARLFPDEHPKPYDPQTHETPWCCGTVLLISRALREEVGGFDERFFMYCEDVDLSWRARAAGFRTRLAPAALVHHYTEARPLTPARERQVRRSAILLGLKYGARAYAEARLAEYRALGGEPFELPELAKPSRALREVAELGHLLKFAEPRW
jgi:N-acetylglucosaminyl-diphospho-decaprenol L-rhamnosyltransferase